MGKWLFSAIGVVLLFCSAHASELFFFDYDGTLFLPKKFDKNTQGIFDTKIKLFKIKNRPNLLVQISEGPDVIEVSSSDVKFRLKKINEITKEEESMLSKKDGRIGSLEKVTLSDGTVIVPGLYRIINPDSFPYYRESTDGRNYLLEDFKRAEQLEVQNLGAFKGPYWEKMINLLNHPETASQFGIITARGHSKKEWTEFFNYLIERGYIKHLPDFRNIHSVNRAEYEKYGMGDGDSIIRKVELLKEIALNLEQKKHTSADYRMHPSGKGEGYFHVLSFVDDQQETIEFAYQELRKLATRRMKLKFIISNAGLDHEVKKSKMPRSFVITDAGVVRSVVGNEAFGEAREYSCSSIFN